jgi:hypothetical protein
MAIVATLVVGVNAASAGAVITYGNTSLGVNDEGHLNFRPLGGGFPPPDPFFYGVHRTGVGDAISPGCLCEGWGVSFTAPGGVIAAGASVDNFPGVFGLSGGTFGSTTTTATSLVNVSGSDVTVQHAFGPSLAADVFQVQVTVTNNGSSAIGDLKYRRTMDWDVPPTEFSELVTHQGVVANLTTNGGNLLQAHNNGFNTLDLRFDNGPITGASQDTDFVDLGPNDHGSNFDFAFGDLAPGASRIFNIFYGSRESELSALSAVAQLGVNLYSLGQPSNGALDTFLFAFGGVGGVEPGLAPDVPVLPFVPAPGQYEFPAPTPRRWFDPPFASGFTYELVGGAAFTSVGAPPVPYLGASDLLDIFIPGFGVVGSIGAGGTFDFTAAGYAPTIFSLLGIDPPGVDAGDPTAFPTFLDWSGTATMLKMTAVTSPAAAPEPFTLALLGLGGAVAVRRRLRQRARP